MPAPTNPQRPSPHWISWTVFLGTLLFAALFVSHSTIDLPVNVAVHFDAAGNPSSFMAHSQYRLFILLFAVGMPLALVAVMTGAYSRATTFKLPNRDYWLAPQRITRTRAFLIGHGIWFGSLLTGFMCFMQWLVADANRQQPPYLSNQALFVGLLIFLGCLATWIAILMVAFRRPNGR